MSRLTHITRAQLNFKGHEFEGEPLRNAIDKASQHITPSFTPAADDVQALFKKIAGDTVSFADAREAISEYNTKLFAYPDGAHVRQVPKDQLRQYLSVLHELQPVGSQKETVRQAGEKAQRAIKAAMEELGLGDPIAPQELAAQLPQILNSLFPRGRPR